MWARQREADEIARSSCGAPASSPRVSPAGAYCGGSGGVGRHGPKLPVGGLRCASMNRKFNPRAVMPGLTRIHSVAVQDWPAWAVTGFALVLYPFSAWQVLALGIPAHLLGRWLKLVRWWSALIVGLVVGSDRAASSQQWQLVLHAVPGVTPADLVRDAFPSASSAGLTGLAFWGIRTWGHTEAPIP